MVPLLLLLLLPRMLADQVCLHNSNGNINITMTGVDIVDSQSGGVSCVAKGSRCVSQCTFSNTAWFNGPSDCLESHVTRLPAEVLYSIGEHSNCTVYLCNKSTILPRIQSLASDSSDQKEMMKLYYIRDSCAKLFSSNHELKRSFIKVERWIIHNIMKTSQLDGGSIYYNLKSLSLNVVHVSEANLTGNESRIQIEAPQLLPPNKSSVPDTWLPVYALQSIPEEKRIIGLVSYMWHNQFQFQQEDISSMVIRIELLGEQRLRDLNTSIQMIFRIDTHTVLDNGSWLQCHYFDEHGTIKTIQSSPREHVDLHAMIKDWLWKADGCETHNRTHNDQIDIICSCNHTTPFAVLLMREPIAELHWKILSYISYIGCGLSSFFTALSLVIYVFSRNPRTDCSVSIHVSLSGALFLLNTTFLLSEWGATVKPAWVCVFVAALMHYSLLCCFTWMAIEALHLYLLLIKVFNTYYKHYLAKLSLAGWGIPGVIVSVTLGVKDFKQFYGVTQMTMADTNQTNAICWITDASFFYSLNLGYFSLVFIFNTGILMAVAASICKMKQLTESKSKLGAEAERKTSLRFSDSCRSGITVLGITCLMGTTWGLAFLGSGYVNYAIIYLFCILNSTQGFFIFLWICLSTKKQRKKQMEDRLTSTPVKTSEVKVD